MSENQVSQTSLEVDGDVNSVVIGVDTAVYPKDAVLGAAYVFIDRCFVLLDAPGETALSVALRGREPLDDEALSALGGEFSNELLAQTLRHRIAEQNRGLLETIVGSAIGGAIGPPPMPEPEGEFDLSELEALELEDEPFDDPLGIAMSWEEKYGDKRPSREEAADAKATAEEEASTETDDAGDAASEDG